MPYFHITARARFPLTPLVPREACVDLWQRLRQRYDPVLACVLMPNHLHLVGEFKNPQDLYHSWTTVLSAFSKSQGKHQKIWQMTTPPELLASPLHLLRQVRYVHLNPCRAKLVRDPLEWEWSTHRDLIGATAPAWLDTSHLAQFDVAAPTNCLTICTPTSRQIPPLKSRAPPSP